MSYAEYFLRCAFMFISLFLVTTAIFSFDTKFNKRILIRIAAIVWVISVVHTLATIPK